MPDFRITAISHTQEKIDMRDVLRVQDLLEALVIHHQHLEIKYETLVIIYGTLPTHVRAQIHGAMAYIAERMAAMIVPHQQAKDLLVRPHKEQHRRILEDYLAAERAVVGDVYRDLRMCEEFLGVLGKRMDSVVVPAGNAGSSG